MIVVQGREHAEMMKVPMLGIVEERQLYRARLRQVRISCSAAMWTRWPQASPARSAKCPIDPQLAALSDAGMIETYGGQFLEGAADACEKLLK